jgi:hypothetical protein
MKELSMLPTTDFPKAAAVLRGCGERSPGAVYIECALSPVGRPFEDFLLDPPLPVPPGLGADALANKPQFWTDPASGTVHLLIWIGAEHYPYLPDFVEESRRFGISRKLSPQLLERPEFARLTLASRLILVHPTARNLAWMYQSPPLRCLKHVPGHTSAAVTTERTGPCLSKTWELVPAHAALPLLDPGSGKPLVDPITRQVRRKSFVLAGRTWFTRRIGSTEYTYAPTSESEAELAPGIFGTFPISGFALIRGGSSDISHRVETRLKRLWREADIPFYHGAR